MEASLLKTSRMIVDPQDLVIDHDNALDHTAMSVQHFLVTTTVDVDPIPLTYLRWPLVISSYFENEIAPVRVSFSGCP